MIKALVKYPNLKPKRVHFVGIGGDALNYLAQILTHFGFAVSGCDLAENPKIDLLRSKGIDVQLGNSPSHIHHNLDELVISSAVKPGSAGWQEVEAANRLTIPVVKREIYWQKLMRCGTGIAVAGTHGKTTTTAMIGYILQEAGFDPTVMVGGFVPEFDGTVRIGKLDYIVLEADEYDRAFLRVAPKVSVITNIDPDHFDTYRNGLPEIRQAFKKFIRLLPKTEGILVAYGKDPNIRQIAKSFDIRYRFYDEENIWPGLKLQIPGLHNRLNATAAARVAHELGVNHQIIKRALNNFHGASRRIEYLGKVRNSMIYDDYAHHPREITATIAALREKYPNQKLLVCFQPHQKRRTKELLAEFAQSLKPADQTLIAPLFYVAGREDNLEISSKNIETAANSSKIKAFNDWSGFWPAFEKTLPDFDICLIMGAGDLSQKVRKKLNLINS